MSKFTKATIKDAAASFLSPIFETHKVGTTEFNFYPVSVAVMFRARDTLKPLAQSLRVLFADNLTDQGQTRRTVADASEIIVAPIAPDLAKLRKEHVDKAIADLIEAVTDDKNATVLGQLLVDSMRDNFERDSMDNASCLAFVKAMDGATLTDMLIGLAKGNRKLLGPFGEVLGATLGRLSLQVEKAAAVIKAQSLATSAPAESRS